jgi:hypothetical protein
MNINAAEEYIIGQLREKLADTLFYHGIHHVMDVVVATANLALQEGVLDEESLLLLKTAALYHDCGFMETYQHHEETGCAIAKTALPGFDYSEDHIQKICGMIMATKIPQSPQTHLERIICDADLDYLGRNDFEPIAQTLFEELRIRNIVPDLRTWNEIQVKFLSAHHYWTESAIRTRAAAKQQQLDHLLKIV